MNKIITNKLFLIVLLACLLPLTSATGDRWDLIFSDGTTTINGTDVCLSSGLCLSEAVANASGDITAVNTDGPYLTGGAASGPVSLLLNDSLLNQTISSLSSGNSSWTQILADTLYAPLGSGNISWNETYADTLYAPLGAGNISWNQTLADTLYAPLGSGNISWNETYADTLYSPLGSGNDSWTQILADTLYVNLSGDIMTGDLNMSTNDILDINDITATGDLIIKNPTTGANSISMESNHSMAVSIVRARSNTGSFASLISVGSEFPGAGSAGNASGIVAGGGRMIFVNNGEEEIAFAHIAAGGSNFSNATYSFRIQSNGDALLSGDLFLEDDQKTIRTVAVDGGSAIVLDSNDTLVAGGFPVMEVARGSAGNRIITRWTQNGRNNSFSGIMNSFGPVPEGWVNFTGETDTEGVSFLFNRSDYINYCEYLQVNLSLVPEGCKYFADTTGRSVPLLFAGDLEVHRAATIHEGATIYDNFNFIERNQSDANFLWTNMDNGGSVHIEDSRTIIANLTETVDLDVDFNDGIIEPFVSTSVAPEAGRDWAAILEAECHDSFCANSKGGNVKTMQADFRTQSEDGLIASEATNISFYFTTAFGAGDVFNVTIDNNEGSAESIYSLIGSSVADNHVSIIVPAAYENKTNVTIEMSLTGLNINREVWIDDVFIFSNFSEAFLINESYGGGRIDFGTGNAFIEQDHVVNNQSLETETRITISADNINLVGDVQVVTVTIVNQNITGSQSIIGNSTVGGNLTVGGSISIGGEIINSWGDVNANSSEYWITDIGPADTVNASQFDNNDQTLTIDESWFTTLWNTIFGGNTDIALTNITENFDESIVVADNVTAAMVVFETNPIHNIYDNATCVKIHGDTSTLEVC